MSKYFLQNLLAVAGCFVVTLSLAQPRSGHQLFVDLVNIENDQVEITLRSPNFDVDTAIYNMPKIVPGTYSISDFGRFVEGFAAISLKGDTLEHIRLDTNRWAVVGAKNLDYVRYRVNDTFDEPRSGIFEPGGTNIMAGKMVLLNIFGFVGYFDGHKDKPFNLSVLRPDAWYGATSLKRLSASGNTDLFTASDYFELHDCPILYAVPDTTSRRVANATIEVAVYSPTGMIKSSVVMAEVEDIFDASAKYLGGQLPVDRYTILLYLSGSESFSQGYGALEHNTSTVFVLPEAPVNALSQTIKDVTAHEFFHIVTPLNIHSEHIHDYDFVNPKMSKHLWLYEGCTEYAAQHVQVKEGLVDIETFLDVMRSKMLAASRFNADIPFTQVSTGALDEHKNQYANVYQQGALIGMALDLKLRTLSTGRYGIQALMADMSKEYGQERPFVDDSLFQEIARISGYDEVEAFLQNHVGGTAPIDYATLLEPFGIRYAKELTQKELSGGSIRIGYNPRRESVVVASTNSLDDFGKSLGLEVGDEIASWDGKPVTLDNFEEIMHTFKQERNEGDKFKIVILKKNNDYKAKTIKTRAVTTERKRQNVFEKMENPTQEQLALRKSWIGQ